jgi:hypothetical protein
VTNHGRRALDPWSATPACGASGSAITESSTPSRTRNSWFSCCGSPTAAMCTATFERDLAAQGGDRAHQRLAQ